jgi:hypothetical protein
MKTSNGKATTIEQIASQYLGVDTLKVRGRDSLDFHDIGVTAMLLALEAAYEAGKAAR